MSLELPKFTIDNSTKIDIEATMQDVLNNGHAFHGTRFRENGHYRRVVEVLPVLDLGYQTPIIGRGEDDNIESALVRACFTFNQSRQFNLHCDDIAEGVIGDVKPPFIGSSPFDRLLDHDTEFWISKKDDEVVAGLSSEEIKDANKFQATASDALTAIESLTKMYHFRRKSPAHIMRLPTTLFR